MKPEIHGTYHEDAVVRCACGNVIKTGSTRKEIRVEICSNCHPYYTGVLKRGIADAGGRMDRFRKKYNWKEE